MQTLQQWDYCWMMVALHAKYYQEMLVCGPLGTGHANGRWACVGLGCARETIPSLLADTLPFTPDFFFKSIIHKHKT